MKLASNKEYIVLNLLRSGVEMYGLEMVKTKRGLKRGTIYVTLDRMVEKGLLNFRKEKTEGQAGLPRRLYIISAEGSRILNATDAYKAALGQATNSWGLVQNG